MGKATIVPIEMVKASNCKMSNGGNVEDALNYSTTEHVVGKWIDGSTVYEKTVECGALPNTTSKQVPHNISNLKNVVEFNGVFSNSTSWFEMNNPNPNNLAGGVQTAITSTSVLIITAANLSTYPNSWVTIRYTKTS